MLADRETPIRVPDSTVRRILCDALIDPVIPAPARPASSDGSGADSRTDAEILDGLDTSDLVHASLDGLDLAGMLELAGRRVLYVGRTQRTVPARLRRALERRDRHCAFTGCRVSVHRCHAHHVREWEHSGPTDIDNTVLLCTAHHHLVHEGRWSITPAPGVTPTQHGYWAFAPPPPREP
jgi:hypothetical protein